MSEYSTIPLDDDTLSQVSGGNWWNSDSSYASGDTPKYSAGQTLADMYIVSVNSGKHGYINKEFTYVVARADNHSIIIDDEMYESELIKVENGTSGGLKFEF